MIATQKEVVTFRQTVIGEKALIIMNDNEDWEKLKARLRKSRVTTNAAAQYAIIDYLKQKYDTEAKTHECDHDYKSVELSSRRRDKFWRRAKIAMNPLQCKKVFESCRLTMIQSLGPEKLRINTRRRRSYRNEICAF